MSHGKNEASVDWSRQIKTLRVAVLLEYDSVNGGENSFLATIPHLRQSRVNPIAIAPPNGELGRRLEAAGVEITPLSIFHDEGPRRQQDELRDELAYQFRRLKPDLVHANSLSMARLSGPVSRELNLPSIGFLRDILRISQKTVVDLNANSRLLAVSQAALQWHVGQGIDPLATFVCYNGVDVQRYTPRSPTAYLHRELDLPVNCRLIGFIGQLGMRKGVDTWLKVAHQLAIVKKDLHFVLIGQQHSLKTEAVEYARQLKKLARVPELTGRIHWLGRREDVPEILNELTVLVHTARQEPLGRVLLESAASGTPVVATEVGGTVEIFPPTQFSELLVPVDDEKAIANAVSRLLADPQRRQQLSGQLRDRVVAKFNSDAAAAELVRHYREVVDPAETWLNRHR